MSMQHRTLRFVTACGVLAITAFATSCTDPVKDHAIERLGPEQGGVPEGPLHRPGQPCVLCHSDGGPASDHKFAIAGTIYDTNAGAKGAQNVQVFMLDAVLADRIAITNEAGNFFIREEEWADLKFPFKTGVLRGTNGVKMVSTVNREGSCNFCHQPPSGDSRVSVGPIYSPGGGAATP
jgi:hypothetical protein